MVKDLFDEQHPDDDEVHMLRFLSTEEGPDDGNNPPAGARGDQAAPAVPPAAEGVAADAQPVIPDTPPAVAPTPVVSAVAPTPVVPAVAPTPVVPAVAPTPVAPSVSFPTSVPTDVSAPPELPMVSDLGTSQVPALPTQAPTPVPAPLVAAVSTPVAPSSSAQMNLPQRSSQLPQSVMPVAVPPVVPRPAKSAKVPKPAAVPVSSVAVQTLRAMLPVPILHTSRGWAQLPTRVVSPQVRDQLFDHPAVFQLPPGESVDSHRDALVIFLRVLGFSTQNSHHLCLYANLYSVFLSQYDNEEHSNQAPPGANVNINGFFTLGKQWRWAYRAMTANGRIGPIKVKCWWMAFMHIDSALYAREIEKFRPYIPELVRGAEPSEMMAMDTSSIGGYSSSSSEIPDSDSDASGGDSLDAPPPPPTRRPPPSRSPSSAGPAMPSNLTDSERARWRMLTDEERSHPSILDLISMDNKAREKLFDAYTAFVATSGKIRRTMEQAAAIVMKCFRKKKNFKYIHSRIDEALDQQPTLVASAAFQRWSQLVKYRGLHDPRPSQTPASSTTPRAPKRQRSPSPEDLFSEGEESLGPPPPPAEKPIKRRERTAEQRPKLRPSDYFATSAAPQQKVPRARSPPTSSRPVSRKDRPRSPTASSRTSLQQTRPRSPPTSSRPGSRPAPTVPSPMDHSLELSDQQFRSLPARLRPAVAKWGFANFTN